MIISILFLTAFVSRDAVDLNLSRVPGAPFTELPDHNIANRVRFRIQNRTGTDEVFRISAVQPEGTEVRVIGNPEIALPDGKATHIDAWVVVPPQAFDQGSATGVFRVDSNHGGTRQAEFRLLGPSRGAQ
ncbi:MAG: FixG Ig-like domain-containing protein [Myxococcota bacterium]